MILRSCSRVNTCHYVADQEPYGTFSQSNSHVFVYLYGVYRSLVIVLTRVPSPHTMASIMTVTFPSSTITVSGQNRVRAGSGIDNDIFIISRNFLSYAISDISIIFYLILYYAISSYPMLSHPILSHPILSHPILSYPILSYHILSYPDLSIAFTIWAGQSPIFSTILCTTRYCFNAPNSDAEHQTFLHFIFPIIYTSYLINYSLSHNEALLPSSFISFNFIYFFSSSLPTCLYSFHLSYLFLFSSTYSISSVSFPISIYMFSCLCSCIYQAVGIM